MQKTENIPEGIQDPETERIMSRVIVMVRTSTRTEHLCAAKRYFENFKRMYRDNVSDEFLFQKEIKLMKEKLLKESFKPKTLSTNEK